MRKEEREPPSSTAATARAADILAQRLPSVPDQPPAAQATGSGVTQTKPGGTPPGNSTLPKPATGTVPPPRAGVTASPSAVGSKPVAKTAPVKPKPQPDTAGDTPQ